MMSPLKTPQFSLRKQLLLEACALPSVWQKAIALLEEMRGAVMGARMMHGRAILSTKQGDLTNQQGS